MAVRQGKIERGPDGVIVCTWTGLAGGDQGTGVLLKDEGPIDIQVIGAIGTSVMAFEGSNDGTNWAGMAFTPTPWVAATISRVTQRALYIRPNVGAGTGASLTVIAVICPGKV